MIKNSTALIATLLLSLFTLLLKAEDAPKKAGPDMQKLAFMTGKWKLDEVDEATPFSPAGKAAFTAETRFLYNDYFIQERGTGKVADLAVSYTVLTHYDAGAHLYRSLYYDSNGAVIHSDGTVEGHTIKGSGEQEVNGRKYRIKSYATFSEDGKTFNYEWSYSEDGVTWKPIFKGTGTRTGK
ncbi:MAG TPA: DUF1579 family protein [Verrucomicrobiae bacterium]|jgi:hypothetical protein|nr:DUF1579 family protein [Verrucomicrobiae bacterium]